MLKIRLMGTKNDMKWFRMLLKYHLEVEILEISDIYQNKGTDHYYRQYIEVKKRSSKEK